MSISTYSHNIWRVRMEEMEPLRKRFDVAPLVINEFVTFFEFFYLRREKRKEKREKRKEKRKRDEKEKKENCSQQNKTKQNKTKQNKTKQKTKTNITLSTPLQRILRRRQPT